MLWGNIDASPIDALGERLRLERSLKL